MGRSFVERRRNGVDMDTLRPGLKTLLLFAIAVVSACAGTDALISPPAVRLTSIELMDADFDRQSFILGFDVANPNSFPLPIKSVRYSVRLGDQQFASGQTQATITVPSNGSAAFRISVEVDLLKTTTRLASFIPGSVNRSLDYELSGSLAVDIPFAKPLEFSHRDSIELMAAGF